MLPLVILGGALYYLSRPRRNPDWITTNGVHRPIFGKARTGGDGRAGDATPYDDARLKEPPKTIRRSGSASSSRTLRGNFSVGKLPPLVRTLDVRGIAKIDEDRRSSLAETADALNDYIAKAPNNAPDATNEQRAKLAAVLPRLHQGWDKLKAVNDPTWWNRGVRWRAFDLMQLVKDGGTKLPGPVAEYSATYQTLYKLPYAKPWNKEGYTRLYLTDGIEKAATAASVVLTKNVREANVYWDDEEQSFGWKMRTMSALPSASDRNAITAEMLREARSL